MSSKRIPKVAEPEESEEPDLEMESLGEDEEFDNPMIQLLVSSEGLTLGESLANLVKHMETQNKILVKMYTLLSKKSA